MTTLAQKITIPVKNALVKNILLSFLGSIAIAISAQITVPMFPVPMTMQIFAVLSVGMVLGSRFGALSVAMYLAEGAMGLPVFAGGGFGVASLLSASGGYLFGFVLSAYIVGRLAEAGFDKTASKTFFAMIIGTIAIYSVGLVWLGTVVGWDKPILAWGFTPFIIGDLVKSGVASALFPALWKKLSK